MSALTSAPILDVSGGPRSPAEEVERLRTVFEAIMDACQQALARLDMLDAGSQAEQLRARRQRLGLSQHALARAAHLSRGLVAEIERGKRRSPQTLAHLARTLTGLEEKMIRRSSHGRVA